MRNFIIKTIEKFKKIDVDQKQILYNTLAEININYENIFDNLNQGIILTDKNYKVKLFNNFIKNNFSLNDKKDIYIWNLFNDLEISHFIKENIDFLYNTENEFKLDKINKYLSIKILNVKEDRKYTDKIINIIDITEKKLNELKKKRDESILSLNNIASSLAHEIKNPLGAISIHIQFVKRIINDNIDKIDIFNKIKDNIIILEEEIERLNNIVVDFLFSLKPVKLNYELVNINNIIKDVISLLKYDLKSHHIDYILQLDKNIQDLYIDIKYTKNILINIINNAKESMQNIENAKLEILTYKENSFLVIKINDNGKGIDKEIISRIFEPYFTTKDFGSGIGLTISYKLIRAHGGDIKVESTQDLGAIFYIFFPLKIDKELSKNKDNYLNFKNYED